MCLSCALLLLLVCCLGGSAAPAGREVSVGDAFARGSEDGLRWSVGTAAVRMAFDCREGKLQLAELQNTLTDTPCDYAEPGALSPPFALDAAPLAGTFVTAALWSGHVAPGATADPGTQRLQVRAGDLLGFCATTRADDGGAGLDWPTTVAYEGGEAFRSAEDAELAQGPVWYTYVQATGTGCLEQLGETVEIAPGVKARVPEGYRAPGECPKLGGTSFELLNALTLVRVWKAPHDGVVLLSGPATHVGGGSPVEVSIVGVTEAPRRAEGAEAAGWKLDRGEARQVAVGGRPAAQLLLELSRGALTATLRLTAHPGTSILRQTVELHNAGAEAQGLAAPAPLTLRLPLRADGAYTHYWLCGGTSRPNQGQLRSAPVAASYHQALIGEKSDNYVPWTALLGEGGSGAGLLVALDYLGTWNLSLDREGSGPLYLTASLPALATYSLQPGETLALPPITLGVFRGDLDDMGVRVYDWQYRYLWDYTNADYYARTKWAVAWFACSRNLQEQFAARLAGLDMDADLMRELGFEMLWDDAGWSKYPGWPEDSYASVFRPTYEGPDYSHTLRYLAKMDMPWLLWFAGRPSAGLMDGKAGAWGDFQWRTDGVGRFGPAADRAYREHIEHFLTTNPRCSYHTCDGGSRFAHQFEVQRLADVNYLSDLGRGDETNHYFSYLELPDKWLDILDPLLNGTRYDPATSRRQLTMAPGWGFSAAPADHEALRRSNEIYRYLRREGVVGRHSYTFHPAVEGDSEIYYAQRTGHDRTKACIVLKHRAAGEVTVRPRGLLPEHTYSVGYECGRQTESRTGADLMDGGIVLRDPEPGELIYLGLPHRPGAGSDTVAPTAPGRVLSRRETNIGHPGVGIYWSPGSDDNWLGFYEVRRGERVLGKVSVGTYYFDHAEGWDAGVHYAVRAVDGDGNASEWTESQRLPDEPLSAWALGGHFSGTGRDGWSAEASTDGLSFSPMAFVHPAKSPAGDLGGTPNQVGGVEGYWEAAGTARVGRGWQQASAQARCVRSWRAPRDGTVRILGRAMKEVYHQDRGGPLRVQILRDSEPIWPQGGFADVPLNDLVGATHDVTAPVRAGDTIRFVLDRSDAPEDALLAWMPRITYTDEAPPASAASVVRILCGADEAFTDSQGNVWSADAHFTGGHATRTDVAIAGAQPTEADRALYACGRVGDQFGYAIPLQPGLYTLRLKLAEPEHEWAFERPMNLSINGRQVLADFDVCQAARGPRRAYERVFRYLVPGADGSLHLDFTSGSEPGQPIEDALVQAIEVLPEDRSVLRINCGAEVPYVDWNSLEWSADAAAGGALRSEAPVAQASPTLHDQRLYQTARCGADLRYSVPVVPGLYTVHLKFAELWLPEAGKRPLHIEVNGRRVRESWDPATAAGQVGMAADLRIADVAPDSKGCISLRILAAGGSDAIVQAIEVL